MGAEKIFVQLPDAFPLLQAFTQRTKRVVLPMPRCIGRLAAAIHFKPTEIAQRFAQESGISVSHGVGKPTLASLNFKYRKCSKHLATGHYGQRDQQFHIIFTLVCLMSLNTPILSIDCKKKERLGNLYREGKCNCQAS